MNKVLVAILFSVTIPVILGSTQNAFADVISLTPSYDAQVEAGPTVGVSCGSPSGLLAGFTNLPINIPNQIQNIFCLRIVAEWDTSSIPDGSTITQLDFKFDVDSIFNPRVCDYMPMVQSGGQPSTAPLVMTIPQLWNEIGDGTPYLTNDSTCQTSGNDKSVTLGSSANTDLQNSLSADWFALGIKFSNEARDSLVHQVFLEPIEDLQAQPPPTLVVTFTPPQDVGGEYFTLDKAALLVAGLQTNLAWIIPVLAAAGIGAVVLRKKF